MRPARASDTVRRGDSRAVRDRRGPQRERVRAGADGLLFNLPVPPARARAVAGRDQPLHDREERRALPGRVPGERARRVDEINVVDTGSTDRTVEIARSFGAKVISREWRNDFGWARNESLALATRRWTLVLDADEEIAPESLPLLRALRETPAEMTGVYLHIQNLVDDVSGGASTMTHILPRLFPTTPRIRYRNVIHESLVVDGGRHLAGGRLAGPDPCTRATPPRSSPPAENTSATSRCSSARCAKPPTTRSRGSTSAPRRSPPATTRPGSTSLETMFAMPGPRAAVLSARLRHAGVRLRRRPRRRRARLALVDARSEETPDHTNLSSPARTCSRCSSAGTSRAPRTNKRCGRARRAQHSMVDDEIFTLEIAAQHRLDVRARGPHRRRGAVVRARAREQARFGAAARADGARLRARRPLLRCRAAVPRGRRAQRRGGLRRAT